jgi:Uma2 family endonuclease
MNAPSRPPLILTNAQFEDMGRKGAFAKVGRVELRRGAIALMSPVHLPHARLQQKLLIALVKAIQAAGKGGALDAVPEISVNAAEGFLPTADIAVFDAVGLNYDEVGSLPKARVKLIVEVADSTLADTIGEKLIDYARAGVPEYWVADVQGKALMLHDGPGENGYRRRVVIAFGQEIKALTLDLVLPAGSL